MKSMYEMIMELPLFKGVSKDQVSSFLEKTHLDFKNYVTGDVIADSGDPVNMVRFVISGEVSIIHPINNMGLSIEERSGSGKVLGAERLFGLSTGYSYKIVARTRTSVMEFSKAQYVSLLHSDRIYMLNFFNYLSLRSQRPIESFMKFSKGDVMNRMRLLVSVMTEPTAEELTIVGSTPSLAEYCGCEEEEIDRWKNYLVKTGIGDCDSNYIKIKSRQEFLEKIKLM